MSNALLNTLYFVPDRDKNGKPCSRYEGVVVAFVVRRDNGTEFEVRSNAEIPFSKKPLTKEEFEALESGSRVQSLANGVSFTVQKVFPGYGDVWVTDEGNNHHAFKYTELRRV